MLQYYVNLWYIFIYIYSFIGCARSCMPELQKLAQGRIQMPSGWFPMGKEFFAVAVPWQGKLVHIPWAHFDVIWCLIFPLSMHLFATAKPLYSFTSFTWGLKQIVLRDVTQRLQLFRFTREHSLSKQPLPLGRSEKHHAMNATSMFQGPCLPKVRWAHQRRTWRRPMARE